MNNLFEAVSNLRSFTSNTNGCLLEYENNNSGKHLDAIINALHSGDINEETFIQNVLDSWSDRDAEVFLQETGWYDDLVDDEEDEDDYYESEKLNEVSDEEQEAFLNSDVTVYDIAAFVEGLDISGANKGEYTAHLGTERALIPTKHGGYILADYEAVRDIVDSPEGKIDIDVSKKPEEGSHSFPIFPAGSIKVSLQNIMDEAPSKTMKAKDFFTKYNYNDRCSRNFSGMLDQIKNR